MILTFLKTAALAAILGLTFAASASAQISATDLKRGKATSSTGKSCVTLDEATKLLKIYEERQTYNRIFYEIRVTKDRTCAAKLKEAGDMMIDLLIGVVTADERAVCEATASNSRKELILKLQKVSYLGNNGSACKELKR